MKLTEEVWNELLSGLTQLSQYRETDADFHHTKKVLRIEKETMDYLNFIGKDKWKQKVIDNAEAIKKSYA
jgi:hypothetical protein